MKNNTKVYSNKQESHVAKVLDGKKVGGSGCGLFQKGDVTTNKILIECKTSMTDKDSYSVKKEVLLKNKKEAFAMNKEYGVLAFNFGPTSENYYVLDEKTFREFITFLNEN